MARFVSHLWPMLALVALLAAAAPAAAQQSPLGGAQSDSSSSTTDVLQKLLLGKVKENSAATATKSTAPAAEHLPRKAAGSGAKADGQPEDKAPNQRTAKPRPARQAELPPQPRLRPAAPISASPTIQLPKPIPMPPDMAQ